jgi:transposase
LLFFRVKLLIIFYQNIIEAESHGVIGKRNGDWFRGFDGYRCNADWNASQNIGQWLGFSCPVHLQEAVAVRAMVDTEGGVNDSPQIV